MIQNSELYLNSDEYLSHMLISIVETVRVFTLSLTKLQLTIETNQLKLYTYPVLVCMSRTCGSFASSSYAKSSVCNFVWENLHSVSQIILDFHKCFRLLVPTCLFYQGSL